MLLLPSQNTERGFPSCFTGPTSPMHALTCSHQLHSSHQAKHIQT